MTTLNFLKDIALNDKIKKYRKFNHVGSSQNDQNWKPSVFQSVSGIIHMVFVYSLILDIENQSTT